MNLEFAIYTHRSLLPRPQMFYDHSKHRHHHMTLGNQRLPNIKIGNLRLPIP